MPVERLHRRVEPALGQVARRLALPVHPLPRLVDAAALAKAHGDTARQIAGGDAANTTETGKAA